MNASNFLFAAHPQSHGQPCSNAQHYSWGQCCSINTVYTVTLCIDGTVTLCVRLCMRVHPHNCLSSPPSRTWIICVIVLFISRNNSKDLFDRHRFPRMHCQHVASFGGLAHLKLFVMEAPLKPAGKNRNNGSFIPPQIFILITDLVLSVFLMFMMVNKYLGLLWETIKFF